MQNKASKESLQAIFATISFFRHITFYEVKGKVIRQMAGRIFFSCAFFMYAIYLPIHASNTDRKLEDCLSALCDR
jgi:hypothetical protein